MPCWARLRRCRRGDLRLALSLARAERGLLRGPPRRPGARPQGRRRPKPPICMRASREPPPKRQPRAEPAPVPSERRIVGHPTRGSLSDRRSDPQTARFRYETPGRPPDYPAGHPACGDSRLQAASPAIPRADVRGDTDTPAVVSRQTARQRCRFAGAFTGATGLEPATSGVTGRFRIKTMDDDGRAIPLFMRSPGLPANQFRMVERRRFQRFAARLLPGANRYA
jgi:hypothetical protein